MTVIECSYFWWSGLDCSVVVLARTCLECKAVKKAPPPTPLHPQSWPSRGFEQIHLNYEGLFQGPVCSCHGCLFEVARSFHDAEYNCE